MAYAYLTLDSSLISRLLPSDAIKPTVVGNCSRSLLLLLVNMVKLSYDQREQPRNRGHDPIGFRPLSIDSW